MKKILIATILSLFPVPSAFADIYRYIGNDGEIIVTTSPRKGLKLLDVIRESKKTTPAPPPSAKKTTVKDRERAFDVHIAKASKAYNIPEAFIRAVIKIESNFNPYAVSYAGAQGLMQLMPATGKSMGVEDPFDPEQNIMGGTKYLRRLTDRYNGDINLVLSAYHAGPGNVDKYNGIPFEKTRDYVENVYNRYKEYRDKAQGKENVEKDKKE